MVWDPRTHTLSEGCRDQFTAHTAQIPLYTGTTGIRVWLTSEPQFAWLQTLTPPAPVTSQRKAFSKTQRKHLTRRKIRDTGTQEFQKRDIKQGLIK